MIRAVLFDFNGVLVDDEPLHFALFQRVLAEEGISLTRDEYFTSYLGFDDRGCFAAVLAKAGRPPQPDLLPRLIARKAAYYLDHVRAEGYPVFPGAETLVRSCFDGGLTIGVVSGALRAEIEGALRQMNLRSCIKTIVGAEDVVASKPDPAGYILGLEQLNALPPLPQRLLHPHEVLAIEDAPAGLEAAIGTGLATLGVAQTYPGSSLAAADHVVESVDDLTLAGIHARFGIPSS